MRRLNWRHVPTVALLSVLVTYPLQAQGAGFDFVLILIGPPGSGKTTQANRLSKTYKVRQVSVPALLKATRGKKVKKKDALAAPIESGDLLNDSETNLLVQQRLKRGDLRPGFILDGYPRSAEQAEFLDSLLKDMAYSGVKVISLEAPDSVLIERMERRGRADDTPAIIERRLAEHREEARPIQDYYGSRQFYRIDAGRTEARVFQDIQEALGLK